MGSGRATSGLLLLLASVVVVALGGLLEAVAAPTSDARARGACQPAGSNVIGRSPLGRVYEIDSGPREGTWACTTRFGRSYQLVDPCCGDVADRPFAFAGRYLAASTNGCEPTGDQCGSGFGVTDMSNGRLRRAPRPARNPRCVDLCAVDMRRIVLKRNASMAWIVKVPQPADTLQVHSVDPTGRRMLDSGDGIDPRSLRLCAARERVCWTANGKRKSASLP